MMRDGVRWALVLAASGLLAGGCSAKTVDLKAIQNFGKTTSDAAASFQDVAADYAASCLRYRDYRGETKLGTEPLTAIPTHAPIVPMPAPEASSPPDPVVTAEPAPPRPTASPTPLPLLAVGADDRDCKASRALSARWQLENQVVVGYVQALADVAGVGTAPDKASFEEVGKALKGAGAIANDATATAGGDLAAAIVGSIVRRKQEHDLVGLAQDAKVPMDTVTDGLKTAALAYRIAVRNELSQLNTNRIALISSEIEHLRQLRVQAGLPKDSPQDPKIAEDFSVAAVERRANVLHIAVSEERSRLRAALLLRDRISRQRAAWSTDVADAVRRANMASDYYRSIAAIRRTNDALVTTHGGLSAVVVTLKPFVDQLSDPVNALIAASKSK